MNIFYIACVCQACGGVYSAATRLGYYYTMVLPLLLPLLISKISIIRDRIIVKIVCFICFLIFGLYTLATNSWAMANPYIWFWHSV